MQQRPNLGFLVFFFGVEFLPHLSNLGLKIVKKGGLLLLVALPVHVGLQKEILFDHLELFFLPLRNELAGFGLGSKRLL